MTCQKNISWLLWQLNITFSSNRTNNGYSQMYSKTHLRDVTYKTNKIYLSRIYKGKVVAYLNGLGICLRFGKDNAHMYVSKTSVYS
jgi:hypothetical protein